MFLRRFSKKYFTHLNRLNFSDTFTDSFLNAISGHLQALLLKRFEIEWSFPFVLKLNYLLGNKLLLSDEDKFYSFPCQSRPEIWFKLLTLTVFSERSSVFTEKQKKTQFDTQFLNRNTCQFHVFSNKNEFRKVCQCSFFRFEKNFEVKSLGMVAQGSYTRLKKMTYYRILLHAFFKETA